MSKKSPKIEIKNNTYESKVLGFLSEIAYLTLDSFCPKQYGYTSFARIFFGLDSRNFNSNSKEIEQKKKIISKTLSRLQNKGLVSKDNKTKKAIWKLTSEGKEANDFLKNSLPSEDGRIRLFVFDIPKSKNRWRDWIRERLMANDYKMLQKSVWVGQRPLSNNFLKMIAENKLFDNIHFFEVKEEGTLSNMNL